MGYFSNILDNFATYIVFFFFKIYLFIPFLAVLDLHCCTWAFSSCSMVVSLVAEHGCQAHRFQDLWCMDLAALWHAESSQTRDQTSYPCIARCILNHQTTREDLHGHFLTSQSNNTKNKETVCQKMLKIQFTCIWFHQWKNTTI